MTPTIAEKRAPLRRTAPRARLLRDAEPVRRRLGEISRLPRLPGAGEHQRRHGLLGGTGRRRGHRAYALKHIGELAGATDLPLNADFEAGFARDAEGVHESARLCVGAGVAGFSIEDYTGDPAAPLYGLSEAVERLRAARAAINASGETVLLTARSEAILRQAGGLAEALRRLAAYAEAGADVLYAPLVRTAEEVAEVVTRRGKAAGQRARRLAGLHPPPARGPRRQAHLGRRRACPSRLGRTDAGGERHCRARAV